MKIMKVVLPALLLSGYGIPGIQAQAPAKITRVEYYVDTDPGYGKATPVSITSDTVVKNVQIILNPVNYITGVHFFGIRALSASGKWSLDNTWLFVKPATKVSAAKLNRVEYYLDSDPGYGNATALQNLGGDSSELNMLKINVDPSLLGNGVHFLGLRARDVKGKWSLDNSWLFVKPESAKPLAKLTRVEYYIDNDPGYGKADTIRNLVVSDTALKLVTIQINPTGLSSGAHLLGIRAKDANGNWSLDNVWLFVKPEARKDRPLLKQVEYFISKMVNGQAQLKDPGYGKGTPVAIDEATQLADFKTPINVSGFDSGSYRLFIRSRDANGAWSLDNTFNFDISPATTAPSIIVNSVTNKTACSGEVLKVSYDAKGSFASSNIFKVQLSDSLGNFNTPTEIGNIKDTISRLITCKLPTHLQNGTFYKVRVISTSPSIISVNTKDSIIIHNRPYQQTITGTENANAGISYSYSVPAITGSTWQWITPAATITPIANTANVMWNSSDAQTLKVVEKDSYGCPGDTSKKVVAVYKLSIDSVIVPDVTPCRGQSLIVTAKVSGLFDAGNTFKAQLSNSSGAFSASKNIGSITLSGTVNNLLINIPVNVGNVSNGTKYRIRVISSLPKDTSEDNGINLSIVKPNIGKDTTILVCPGGNANLTIIYNTSGYSSVDWNTANPQSAPAGNYRLIVQNAGGCADTAFATVGERINPAPVISPSGDIKICAGDSLKLSVVNNYAAYSWNTGASTFSITVKTVGEYKVTVTDVFGCQGASQLTTVSIDTCGKPASLIFSNVAAASAVLSWNPVPCATQYEVRYKSVGSAAWTTVKVNSVSKTVTGLSSSTTYSWQVRAVCKGSVNSNYSEENHFTTPAQSLARSSRASPPSNLGLKAFVSPNPAKNFTLLNITNAKDKVQVTLLDVQGKVLWKSQRFSHHNIRIPLEWFAGGTLLLKVTDAKGSLVIPIVKE